MNLKRFIALMEVADRSSFSEAAIKLGLTQPAVSKQIKTLEQELGVTLFYREQANAQLTEAGVIAYQTGKRLIREWEELVHSCQSFGTEITGLLHIGVSTIPGAHLLPQGLVAFRTQYPHVDLSVHVQSSADVLASLGQGSVDVAIVGILPEGPEWKIEPLQHDEMYLIGPPDTDRAIGPQDLVTLPLIARTQSSGTKRAVENALLDYYHIQARELRYIAHVEDTHTQIAMVEGGLGFAFVSSLAINRAQVKKIFVLPVVRTFYLVIAKSNQKDRLIHAFWTLLMDHFHIERDGEK
ncbi:MAG: selenium metabolism-associated LysR family transcriptional regulator [Acidibacillus sp.]|nr:selenium metabolism-associated LysR family transcriptional regulator [Acidibacillus sp.]